MSEQEKFEAWIKSTPFEHDVARYPNQPTRFAWPGQYKDLAVQLAWCAWQEAVKPTESEKEEAAMREAFSKANLTEPLHLEKFGVWISDPDGKNGHWMSNINEGVSEWFGSYQDACIYANARRANFSSIRNYEVRPMPS